MILQVWHSPSIFNLIWLHVQQNKYTDFIDNFGDFCLIQYSKNGQLYAWKSKDPVKCVLKHSELVGDECPICKHVAKCPNNKKKATK